MTAILIAILLSGCGSSSRATHSMIDGDEAVDPTAASLMAEYRIGVGDMIGVSVWRNPDLSTQVVVLPDGKVAVPLVGDVEAAGLTTEQLAVTISDTLNNFIRQPEVTVSVLTAASSEYLQRIRITGAVGNPLSVPYRRGVTVLDLVLQAGGITPFANPNKALLYREEEGELAVYPVRLGDILNRGRLDTNYPLLPSDIITVPEKSF